MTMLKVGVELAGIPFTELNVFKGAMVSNSALAAICVLSGLYRHLHYDSYPLGSSFETYLKWLELRRVQETESATREGKSPGQYWLDIEPPKVWFLFTRLRC